MAENSKTTANINVEIRFLIPFFTTVSLLVNLYKEQLIVLS